MTMVRALASMAVAFAATNVDDVVLLMIVGAKAGGDKTGRRHIWMGQFLALGAITGLSVLLAVLLGRMPPALEEYTRFLGIVPILLGLWHAFETLRGRRKARRHRVKNRVQAAPRPKNTGEGVGQVFGMLFSAGVDNAGVYIPLFAGQAPAVVGAGAAMFMVLAGVLCFAALKLAGNARVEETVQKYENVIVPVVLVAIGTMVLVGA